VIFALLAFGQLFGFVGILLALPASAILSVVFGHLRRHYLNSSFYNQS
jgi:predicted PurR-regulated permease PerM